MSKELFELFDSWEDKHDKKVPSRETIAKAPFGYPGGKSRSVKSIIEHIPQTGKYVEVFGGSGVILLNMPKQKFEVYNDRYGGVVDFYKCMVDKSKMDAVIDFLMHTFYSRETFIDFKETWCNSSDIVERAAKWYYMNQNSFGCMKRNFGRDLANNTNNRAASDIRTKFVLIHNRMRHTMIENLDWRVCMKDFDSHDAVFYLDPPYMMSTTSGAMYEYDMPEKDHRELCETIFNTKGFVALSGYDNEMYSKYPWDDIKTWEVHVSITPLAFTEGNHFEGKQDQMGRGNREECLYIKYA